MSNGGGKLTIKDGDVGASGVDDEAGEYRQFGRQQKMAGETAGVGVGNGEGRDEVVYCGRAVTRGNIDEGKEDEEEWHERIRHLRTRVARGVEIGCQQSGNDDGWIDDVVSGIDGVGLMCTGVCGVCGWASYKTVNRVRSNAASSPNRLAANQTP
jgi:hypothetical protein